MLNLCSRITGPVRGRTKHSADDSVALPWELRARSRLRVTLASGREAGIVLPRRERLRPGDLLQGDDGTVVAVLAADEPLLEARAFDLLQLTRAAYHLGNRHVPVQVVDIMTLRLPVDHVLAQMLEGLGLLVETIRAPFEPEGGAYAGSELHATDHTHMLDRTAPVRIRRANLAGQAGEPADEGAAPPGLVDPGHGEHRSPRRIHEFADAAVAPALPAQPLEAEA